MFLDSISIQKRLITSEEALRCLRHRVSIMEASAGRPFLALQRDTLVRDWLRVGGGFWLMNLVTELSSEYWFDVGEMLNTRFGIEVSDAQWLTVLKPMGANIGQLCDFIASQAQVEIIPTIRLTGKPCLRAGLFLALRARLQSMCGFGQELYPSSRLPSHPEKVFAVSEALAVLAPMQIPAPEHVVPPPAVTRSISVMFTFTPLLLGMSFLCGIMTAWFKTPLLVSCTLGLFGLTLVCFMMAFCLAWKHDHYHWHGLRTYRDLVRSVTLK